MLDTSELEFIFSTVYHQWLDDQKAEGRLLCDLCQSVSPDGRLYNLPGADEDELLVCLWCFQLIESGNPCNWGG